MSLDPALGPGSSPRWITGALWSILVATCIYTVARALTITVDLYDGYVYLYNASRLAGTPLAPLDDSRPWLLSVLQAPVAAAARLLGPANPWLLRGPHLLSAAVSLGAVAAVIALMRQVFAKPLALLGGVLFVANRCYVHYCANVLTDLGVTGLCVLSLALHLHAVRTRKLSWFLAAGVAFGAAICMKFTAPTFGITLAAVELGALVTFEPAPGRRLGRPRLRFDGRRWLYVVAEVLALIATFVAVQVFVFTRLYGGQAWNRFKAAWAAAQQLRHTRYPGEVWSDNVPMAITIMSASLLVLAALGLIVAARRPRRNDLPFAAGLAGVGGSMLFAIGHSEARYLMPVVPCVIYFALRAAEGAWSLVRASPDATPRAKRPVAIGAAVVVVLLVAGTLANGAKQLAEDHDPFFGRDFQGRAGRALAAARRPGRPAFVMGYWHTLSAAKVGPVPQDEFWNTYHSSPFVFEYLLGEPVTLLPGHAGQYDAAVDLLARTVDGDALVRFNDVFFMTAGFPTGPRDQALEVWKINRRELVPSGPPGHFGPAPGSAPVGEGELRVQDGRVTFAPRLADGPWIMFARTGAGPWAYFGISPSTPGEPILMPPTAASTDGITLLRVDIARFD